MHYKGLLNGDETLNNRINEFLNENWADIFAALKPTVEETFAKVIKEIINNVFRTTPYRRLFKE